MKSAKSSGYGAKLFSVSEPRPDFTEYPVEDLEEVNARKEIREHLIVERMRYWLMVARNPFAGKGRPRWQARKNYWALQKKHAALAARHGLTETSVFLAGGSQADRVAEAAATNRVPQPVEVHERDHRRKEEI